MKTDVCGTLQQESVREAYTQSPNSAAGWRYVRPAVVERSRSQMMASSKSPPHVMSSKPLYMSAAATERFMAISVNTGHNFTLKVEREGVSDHFLLAFSVRTSVYTSALSSILYDWMNVPVVVALIRKRM